MYQLPVRDLCNAVLPFVPWHAAASIQPLSWGVGGDDWETQALP